MDWKEFWLSPAVKVMWANKGTKERVENKEITQIE